MLKKIISLLFLPFLFCSCTSKPHYETITFSSWGSITETKILKDLISDFEKNTPEIKINFMHIPQNYFQKIHLLFASSLPLESRPHKDWGFSLLRSLLYL